MGAQRRCLALTAFLVAASQAFIWGRLAFRFGGSPARSVGISQESGSDAPARRVLEGVQLHKGNCNEDSTCCGSNHSCAFFCSEGQEIVERGQSGWHVKGSCARKWEGFCREDEECGAHKICVRSMGKREGTCQKDVLCETMSCGPGHCLNGQCQCGYHYRGENCEHTTNAAAFLFYGGSAVNLVQARVLVRSLQDLDKTISIYAIVPDAYVKDTPTSFLDILKASGVRIFTPPHIAMPPVMMADPIISQRWAAVMDKFNLFLLTNHSKVAVLDLDMVFDPQGDPPSQLFDDCDTELCAVRDGDPRFMNAGVMVATPSEHRLAHIVSALAMERHHYDMPEQSFLTRYAEQPENQMSFTYLDRKWNSCVGGGMLLNTGPGYTGFNVLHSCSWTLKPGNMKLEPVGTEMYHTVQVFQSIHMKVDACAARSQDDCSESMDCNWCGHYCSNVAVPCHAALFLNSSSVETASRESFQANETDETDETWADKTWADLPSGHYAWPKVGIYQILLDRFASPQEKHCEDLTDYCGGTLAAAAGKLDYLKELGVDGISLSPVIDNMPGGYHGYWPKDLNAVNPELGTEGDLAQFIFQAHTNEMKVISDVVLNHAGSPLMKLEDLSMLSPFGSIEDYHQDNCSLWEGADFAQSREKLERCSLFGMPDYNHEDPRVSSGLMKWVRTHVDTYGFDGIRIDAAKHMPLSFLRHLAEDGAPVPTFYEVPSSDLQEVASYNTGDFSAVYNYPLYHAIHDVFVPGHARKPMRNLEPLLTADQSSLALNFLDNNDIARFAHLVQGDEALYQNALVAVTMAAGVPVLLYGSEQALLGRQGMKPGQEHDGYRLPMWEVGYERSETFKFLKSLLWLRNEFDGFHRSAPQILFSDHNVLAFERGHVQVILTSRGSSENFESRIMWGNASRRIEERCNLLSVEKEMCMVLPATGFQQVDLHGGKPLVMVPRSIFEKYKAELKSSEAELKSSKNAVRERQETSGSLRALKSQAKQAKMLDLRLGEWRNMPESPELELETIARFSRPQRQEDVVQMDCTGWSSNSDMPYHLDHWYPPLGVLPSQSLQASVLDGCVTSENVVARRQGTDYGLCNNDYTCSQHFSSAMFSATFREKPLLHITYGQLYTGFYHMLVEILPRFVEYLPSLKQGDMDVLLPNSEDAKALAPLMSRLGVPRSSLIVANSKSPLCSKKVIFKVGLSSPMSPSSFVDLRSALSLPRPSEAGHVVILSRGSSSRALRNEGELAHALESLGHKVVVWHAHDSNLPETIDVLSKAELIVGAHGANLVNMLYAPPDTKVIEIVPQVPFPMVNSQYRTFAGALGFEYRAVGQHVSHADINFALKDTPAQAIRGYSVDIPKVKEAVASLLRAKTPQIKMKL